MLLFSSCLCLEIYESKGSLTALILGVGGILATGVLLAFFLLRPKKVLKHINVLVISVSFAFIIQVGVLFVMPSYNTDGKHPPKRAILSDSKTKVGSH